MNAGHRTCLFAIALLLPMAAQALPPGSYQQSCQNIDIKPSGRGYVLTAQCMRYDHRLESVSMDLDEANRCKDLINTDGHLICVKDTPDIPAGSYRNSCQEINVQNDLLRARCLTEKGHLKPTYYPLKTHPCPKGLANNNGALVCE